MKQAHKQIKRIPNKTHTQIRRNPNKPTKKNETHRKPQSLYDSDLVEREK